MYSLLVNAVNRLNRLTRGSKSIVSATGGTVTDENTRQNGGAIVSNAGAAGAATFALPPAKKGMRVTAIVQAAQQLRLDPNGTETIALPSSGVQSAAGKYVWADAIGETATFVCIVDGKWDCVTYSGTWTAEA